MTKRKRGSSSYRDFEDSFNRVAEKVVEVVFAASVIFLLLFFLLLVIF